MVQTAQVRRGERKAKVQKPWATLRSISTWTFNRNVGRGHGSVSWPSSPPHWLSQKRNTAHVKPPSPFYFINRTYLHWPGGLMEMMFVGWDGFSRVVATFVFDSWCMYSFSGALTSVAPSFSVFLVTFCFLLVFYFVLCSSFIFPWH